MVHVSSNPQTSFSDVFIKSFFFEYFFQANSYLFLSHKNANACGDKAAESQLKNIPILTIWCPADSGKSEIDPRGADFARCARENLVEECLEKHVDPRKGRNLVDAYNANHRKPTKSRKNSRLVDREAQYLSAEDIQWLRYLMPVFETLVIINFLKNWTVRFL